MSDCPEDSARPASDSEVTVLLRRLSGQSAGAAQDAERLLELIYDELRRLAASLFRQERDDHTLQPTALVHEAWLRLADQDRVEWRDKSHFFAIAGQAMRRVLVDHVRARSRDKRGAAWRRVELDVESGPEPVEPKLLELDSQLEKLARVSPQQARLVEMRFFAGLSMSQVAEILGMSLRTAEREWRFARAWIMDALLEEC